LGTTKQENSCNRTNQIKPEELKEYSKADSRIIKALTDDEVLSTIYKRLNLKKFKAICPY
jgi:hypothetical protein